MVALVKTTTTNLNIAICRLNSPRLLYSDVWHFTAHCFFGAHARNNHQIATNCHQRPHHRPQPLARVGMNACVAWIEVTQADGSIKVESIKGAALGQRMLEVATANNAIAPAWQAKIAQVHSPADEQSGQASDNTTSSLRIARVAAGTGGTVTLNASGNVVFTPTANYNGTATFTKSLRVKTCRSPRRISACSYAICSMSVNSWSGVRQYLQGIGVFLSPAHVMYAEQGGG